MRYFYQTFSLFLLGTLFVLFFNVTITEASVIIRPPNNLGLVGYWSFDEGRGTEASDMSGNGNDGLLNGSPEWVSGKSRGALEFGGVGNYINVSSSSSLSFPEPELTMSAWFRFSDSFSNERALIRKDGQYQLGFNNSGTIRNLIATNGTTGWTGNNDISYSFSPNTWYLLTVTYDGSIMTTYVDGVNVDTAVVVGDISINGGYLGIGGNLRPFIGKIDEVRIYNRALSASEIQSLYINTRSTVVGVTPVDRYNDGLVAHWTFDGKHTSATTVEDIVGDSDGTINGATPTRGIIGQAMQFNGGSSAVSVSPVPQIATNAITVSAWFKTNSLGFSQAVVRKNGLSGTNYDYVLRIHETSNMIAWAAGKVTGNISGVEGFSVTPGVWYHVVGTKTDSGSHLLYVNGNLVSTSARTSAVASGESLYLGGTGFSSIDGTVDDLRIYNRALSAAEVAGLYSATSSSKMQSSTDELVTSGLVGHWSFDASTVSGGTVSDVSSSGKHGTVFGNPGPVAGKIGDAMAFDGAGDYVRVSALGFSSDSITVAYWAQIQRTNGLNYAFDTNNERDSLLKWSDQNTSVVQWGLSGTYPTYNQGNRVNEWVHYALIANGTNEFLYINGVEVASIVQGEAIVNFEDLWIGAYHGSGYSMQGLLDDFRIYNRALTEVEITQLYSMGQ